MKKTVLYGKPHMEKLLVRFDARKVAPVKPRRGSLFHMTIKILAAYVSLFALPLIAAELTVERYEHLDMKVEASATITDTLFISPEAGSVTKSGAGIWTLPLANCLRLGDGFELGLLNGTLNLTAGVTPDYVTTPPAVLQDAAIWLTAEKNVSVDDVGDVIGWYDARENSAAAVNYGYATTNSTVSGSLRGPTTMTFDDKPALSFVGHVSQLHKSLELKTATGSDASYAMCDAFYVMALDDNLHFAPVLGNKSAGYFFTNPGKGTVLSDEGNALWQAYQCEFRHNGAVADPAVALGANKRHLCEFTTCSGRTIPIDSIFRDRSLASGGHYLHELVIFTRHLTASERAQVTAYLLQKWEVNQGQNKITVNGVNGMLVKAEGGLLDQINIIGDAMIGTTSDSFSPSLKYQDRHQLKHYRLSTSGEQLNVEGTEYSLKLMDGDRITIDDSSDLVRTVANAADGTAGEIVVTGAQRALVLDRVPTTKLTAVSSVGDIILRAPVVNPVSYKTNDSALATLSGSSLSVPAGTGGATVSVTIPTVGDWEFSFDFENACTFKTGSAWTDGRNASYYVQLYNSDNALLMQKIALTVKPSEVGGKVQHRRYLARGLVAGTYTLKFAGYLSSTFAATVSNLAFEYVPNIQRETVVPMTHGDFENMTFNKACFASRDNNGYSGWTLTNGGLPQNPAVQTIINGMMGFAVTSTGYDFEFRAHELGRYGDNALMWIHTNSVSQVRNTAASPATTLPAGTWKLRMKACRMTTGPTNFDKVGINPATNNRRCGKNLAVYTAQVTINDTDTVDLGESDAISTFAEKAYTFPNAFTVAEGDSVTVFLDQLVGWSFSVVDDFEFVKVEDAVVAGLGPELIKDGSFELDGGSGGSNWTRDNYNDGTAHRVDLLNPTDSFWGSTYCDGYYAARAFNAARAYQPVMLEQGVYRLSYWSRARCDYVHGEGDGTPSAVCKLHFWYAADGAATTNVIVTGDTLWSTNFYETTALFEVKTAGTYNIGFNPDAGTGYDSLTDCISVRKVLDTQRVPDIAPDAELELINADGRVRLDYVGTLNVESLRINGKRLYNEVTSETCPEYVTGPGKILVTGARKGTTVILR